MDVRAAGAARRSGDLLAGLRSLALPYPGERGGFVSDLLSGETAFGR